MVVQPKYDCLRHFSATSTNIASLNHKWGFIDGAEQVVVPFQFDHLNFLIDTLYAASVNGKWGILSRSGRWVLHPRFERIRSTFYDEDEEEEEEPITYGRGRWRRTSSVSVASFNKTSEDGALSPAGIRVFPNPTRGQLSIELRLQDHGSYRLYDAKGAVVRSGVLEQPITSLDITALAAGVYTMLVQEDGKTSKISVTKL
jgi:hypothetical protein